MQAFLNAIEIDPSDAWTFFKLLDSDGGGSVDIEEFVEGCCRLRGNAKSIHVAQMMYENKWIMNKLTEIGQELQDEDADSLIDMPPLLGSERLGDRRSNSKPSYTKIDKNGDQNIGQVSSLGSSQ